MNMNKTLHYALSFLVAFLMVSFQAFAYINLEELNNNSSASTTAGASGKIAASCLPPSSAEDLDINNIRALIQTGGDMWWDLQQTPKYEVPKGSGKTSIFAGSLWLGGVDVSNQLKVAAQRFRSQGNDFWTGPLRVDNAETTAEVCQVFDKHFKTTKQEVEQFVAWNAAQAFDAANGTSTAQEDFPGYSVPLSIQEWPAHPGVLGIADANQYEFNLAPFVDLNGNGLYEWQDGDYPAYDLAGDGECNTEDLNQVYGDQNLWWVFNDNGNIHTESGSAQAIGMEIRAQAFAFATNDEVNNMTFYNYQLINRSTFTLTETYFGFWVDADLGGANDDYVGCDVSRGLGYCYNGDAYDDNANGALGYLDQPPAIGVDFFQGPFQDADGEDNEWGTGFNQAVEGNGVGYSDSIVDNERFGMRRFLYHNIGSGSPNFDPITATDYYNYLRGIWKDGTQMVHGGNGHINGCSAPFSCRPTSFMFPGPSDQQNWGTGFAEENWTEVTAGNTPGDRRFAQSAGPFTLAPGAKNYITVGVVWAQASTGGPQASIDELIFADNKTQAAFNNCFQILEGPNAPELTFQELDQELVVFMSNPQTSNNYQEAYAKKDPSLDAPDSVLLSTLPAGTVDTLGYNPIIDSLWSYSLDSVMMIDTILVQAPSTFYYDTNYIVTLDSTFLSAAVIDSIPILSGAVTNVNVYQNLNAQQKEDYERYYFQGYKVYQVKNKSVSVNDLDDADLARLVFQCDIEDQHTTLINYEFDENLQQTIPKLKAEGENLGISHSFNLLTDAFAEGDNKLINHKEVYYMAVAYAVNYSEFNVFNPSDPLLLNGQKLPYIESGKSATGTAVKVFTAVPHKPEVEAEGTVQNSEYGDEVELTRLEGIGNGNREIRMTQETEDRIMSGWPYKVADVTYQEGYTPVSIKVVDPLIVPKGAFTFKILEDSATQNYDLTDASWELTFVGDSQTIVYTSDLAIQIGNEQILPEVGLSVYIKQAPVTQTGQTDDEAIDYINSVLTSSIEYSDEQWITAIEDNDGASDGTNWIRAGLSDVTDDDPTTPNFNEQNLSDHATGNTVKAWIDPAQIYEQILGGTWAPFKLGAIEPEGPVPSNLNTYNYTQVAHLINNSLEYLNNVDVVLTDDKSKWTRAAVIEMQRDNGVTIGGANKGFLRRSPSLDKNGNSYSVDQSVANWWQSTSGSNNEDDANYIGAYGMSWFPGYAIDQETGERLNIAFGEDSWLQSENGGDMQWNPTSNITEGPFDDVRLGGKHYIIVFRNNVFEDRKSVELSGIAANNFGIQKSRQMPSYDAGQFIYDKLVSAEGSSSLTSAYNSRDFKSVYQAAAWTSLPLLTPGFAFKSMADGLVPSSVRVRLRVRKPYRNYVTTDNLIDVGEQLPEDGKYYVLRGPIDYNGTVYNHGEYFDGTATSSFSSSGTVSALDAEDNVALTQNYGRPLYTFNTDKYAVALADNQTAVNGLDIINVVPNPYYAYSQYETDRLDNRIKITNLPDRCTVRIYTTNGVLVRTLTKDDASTTSLQWDLKNDANITIASGIYIIHVEAPGIGERVLKWFGMTRPIDLDSF